MKLRLLAASALTLATLMSTSPARAEEDDRWLERIVHMADKNKDSMVTRKEFVDAMGQLYDQAMTKMKNDSKMVKGDMMTTDGIKALLKDLYRGV